MDKPMDVLRDFPVRKTKKQKEQFRAAVRAYTESLGYDYQEETGRFGSRNVVLGNPEQAEILITAHYDTCARLPFPNLLTPCNLPLLILCQLLVAVLFLLVVFVVDMITLRLTDSFPIYMLVSYAVLFAMLYLMLRGPANRHNANDNTSGVVTVLETAASLPPEQRSRVCFVLFDLEEAGLIGSASYRKQHKAAIQNQLMLNLDCVGDGDALLLVPSKGVKRDTALLQRLQDLCPAAGQKSLTVRDRGFVYYPSDQRGFPLGVGVAAFRRSKWAGLYLGRIHTGRDTILDETNVYLLRDYLLRVIEIRKEP